MSTVYPLKVQAIRSRGQHARLYVYFPLPLAAAIGLEAGEQVQWELLDRGELHLLRRQVSAPAARSTSRSARTPAHTLSEPARRSRPPNTQ